MIFKIFQKFPNLQYGISEKSDGAMELANSGLTHKGNRQKFFLGRGINAAKIISPKQSHSANVVKVKTDNAGGVIENADGLATDDNNLFLTVTVADCFPIYFYNPKANALGLAHSGWRGTVADISGEVVKAMPGAPQDILAGIGPGIQSCHFEIKEDTLEKFSEYPSEVIRRSNKIFIDLPKIISVCLIAAGVPRENIESCGECTFCQKDKYFSFRRDKPKNVEAMIAYIRM